jgi:hypothetical protein
VRARGKQLAETPPKPNEPSTVISSAETALGLAEWLPLHFSIRRKQKRCCASRPAAGAWGSVAGPAHTRLAHRLVDRLLHAQSVRALAWRVLGNALQVRLEELAAW